MAKLPVIFVQLTQSQYQNISQKDNGTLYFCTDTQNIYLGSKKYGGSDVTVDTELSETSTNPVQNKAVKSAMDEKFDKSGGQVAGSIDVTGTVNPKSIAFKLADYQTTEIIPNTDPKANEIQLANSFSGTAGPAYCRLAICSPDPNNDDQAVNVAYLNLKLSDKSGTVLKKWVSNANPTVTKINELTLNNVISAQLFEQLKSAGALHSDELYLVAEN